MIVLLTAFLSTATPVYEVHGEGFFRLERNGQIVYAKSGSFHVKDGFLAHESGLRLSPPVRVTTADGLRITPDGFVISGERTVSHLVLAKFENGGPSGSGVLSSSEKPQLGNPGDTGFGVIGRKIADQETSVVSRQPAAKVPAGFAHSIVVRDTAEVASTVMLIGDIADVGGPDAERIRHVEIGPAPRPAEQRLITAATVQGALRAARINPDTVFVSVPQRAIVRRATRSIESGELETAARAFIAEKIEYTGPLTLATQFTSRTVPQGETSIRIGSARDTNTAFVIGVEVFVDRERQFSTQFVFNKTAGATASSSSTPAVRPGQTVRVVLVSNAVVVEATGRIRSAGAVGDVVTVEIDETKATLSGVLQSDGSVEVRL